MNRKDHRAMDITALLARLIFYLYALDIPFVWGSVFCGDYIKALMNRISMKAKGLTDFYY
jgi:hypothetical protein